MTKAIPSTTHSVKRTPIIEGDLAYIPLTKGYVAVIDAVDLPLVERWNWKAMRANRGSIYAVRNTTGNRAVLLHRVISGALPGEKADHIDGDTLNDRRSNLRRCTQSENMCNSRLGAGSRSGIKGVCWDASRKKWKAQLKLHGKHVMRARFSTKEEAAEAVRAAREKYHGEFARHE